MGTLGAKTSQWRPGHVPYLPYSRYATGTSMQVAHVKQERFPRCLMGLVLLLFSLLNYCVF